MGRRQAEAGSRVKRAAGPDGHRDTTSIWEWMAAAVGLILVVATISYLAYSALTREAKVPAVLVEFLGVERTPGGYVVRFRAHNRSNATAAGLQVKGDLTRDGTVMERSEATLDYLPPFSERLGGLIFQEDPRQGELRIMPGGYTEP